MPALKKLPRLCLVREWYREKREVYKDEKAENIEYCTSDTQRFRFSFLKKRHTSCIQILNDPF